LTNRIGQLTELFKRDWSIFSPRDLGPISSIVDARLDADVAHERRPIRSQGEEPWSIGDSRSVIDHASRSAFRTIVIVVEIAEMKIRVPKQRRIIAGRSVRSPRDISRSGRGVSPRCVYMASDGDGSHGISVAESVV